MGLDEPPTAVFCYNDMTAIGLLRAARETGLTIPEDLAVVGFDDILLASYVSPSLTTIAQSKAEMGQLAMHMALDLMQTTNPAAEGISDIVVKGKLIKRESSASVFTFQSRILLGGYR
jgi:DNA-binding LacI/PurR family transcriptional regulator